MFDATAGAAGESLRRLRPEIALVDTALPRSVVDICLDAADEVGTPAILMSSRASAIELEQEARLAHRLHFALPGGPKPLAVVLESALSRRASRPPIVLPPKQQFNSTGSVHPALRAALASLARTSVDARVDRRSLDALRAAVTDYARQLRALDLPVERVVNLVQDAMADCATVVGAEAAMPALLVESENWARSA